MNRALIDFWVGLFVVIGIAAVFFIAIRVANLVDIGMSTDYQITASFDNIGGLKMRAPV
jgi:phospholipid/cholesterol/gamma-HCH transport system substrate-binding protein